MTNPDTAAEKINKDAVPRIISERYPDISDDEAEEVRQHVVAQMAIMAIQKPSDKKTGKSETPPDNGSGNDDNNGDGNDKKRQPADNLIQQARKLMDVHELVLISLTA